MLQVQLLLVVGVDDLRFHRAQYGVAGVAPIVQRLNDLTNVARPGVTSDGEVHLQSAVALIQFAMNYVYQIMLISNRPGLILIHNLLPP